MSDIELKAMWSAIEEWRSMGDAEKSEHLSMTDFIWNRALSFARSGEGHEKDFPECPHCGGTGLEVVSKTETTTEAAPDVRGLVEAAVDLLLTVRFRPLGVASIKAIERLSVEIAKHGAQS